MKQTGGGADRLPIFRVRLRELQGNRSNTEFAEFLGMSRQTIGFYLNGNRIPDALGLLQIAEKCRVSSDWLIGLSNIKGLDGDIKQVCGYTGLSQGAVECLHKFSALERYKELLLSVLNKLIGPPILNFVDYTIRAALASVQREKQKRTILTPGEVAPGSQKRDLMLMEEAVKEIGTASNTTEITAFEASQFYKIKAEAYISGVVDSIIEGYIDKTKVQYINIELK